MLQLTKNHYSLYLQKYNYKKVYKPGGGMRQLGNNPAEPRLQAGRTVFEQPHLENNRVWRVRGRQGAARGKGKHLVPNGGTEDEHWDTLEA